MHRVQTVGVNDMSEMLARRLDLILENETTQVDDNPYQNAMSISTELDVARRKVADLERQLIYATDRLCGGLAMGVRKHRPGLNASIGNGCCKIGYKSKHLAVRPDITGKVWLIDSTDPTFARRFSKQHGPRTALDSNIDPLAQAIAMFFGTHYRSLGEDIIGRGLILIDNKRVSIETLVEYIAVRDQFLANPKPGFIIEESEDEWSL